MTSPAGPLKNIAPQAGLVSKAARQRLDLICLLIIACLGALLYLPMLGSYVPLDPSDSWYIESTREMYELGNYMFPLVNYQIWLDKPILAFWLIVASFKIFGVHPFAARLVSAVPAIALALLIYVGSRPFLRRRASFLAAIIFLSCPLVSVIGHLCLTDMLLGLLISACLLFLFKAVVCGTTKDAVTGYVALGLAVLCKGPIAIVLVALTIVLYAFLTQRSKADWHQYFQSTRLALGVLIVLAINLPWYLAAIAYTHGAFFYEFFIRQNLGRVMGTVNHQCPWWYYIPILVFGLLPYTLYVFVLPRLFAFAWKFEKKATPALAKFFLFSLCWAVVVLVLFGSLKTKLPTYILPAVPPIAILIAIQLDLAIRLKLARRLLVPGLILLAGGLFAAFMFKAYSHGFVGTFLRSNAIVVVLLIVGVFLHCWLLLKRKTRLAVSLLTGLILVACGILVPSYLINQDRQHQQGFNKLVWLAKTSGAQLAILFAEQPSVSYILHSPVPRITCEEDMQAFLKSLGSKHWIIVPKEVMADLVWSRAQPRLMANSGKWYLFALD